jgi:hypothetical protein
MQNMAAWLTTLLDLAGAALIVTGLALVFVPAAFVTAGAACLLISWRAARR